MLLARWSLPTLLPHRPPKEPLSLEAVEEVVDALLQDGGWPGSGDR
ncbi:MAG: hypothetical protein AVDCRST_MAG18-1340 [uncultured Thermomicrobiales bacterium]|uniref:Uncharacterized protein n=1 Tax=uncultured Thermomicrobiales bacterium TaxID=1645740 RepID=A0A6J4V3G0_9BACT|nr:MAG: hypothetical protein AVDCRST_MAG18-1340 [uncultured Thermomicrobiales bacterium]